MHQVDHNDLAYAAKRFPNLVGWIPDVRGEKGKINPHMTRFVDKAGYLIDVFHVKPVYYETIHGHWRPLTEVASIHRNREVVLNRWQEVHPRYINWLHKRMQLIGGQLLIPSFVPSLFQESMQYARIGKLGLTTTTVYPDPDPETTTVDGAANRVSVNEAFATIRAGAGNASGDSVALDTWSGFRASSTTDQYQHMWRGFCLFDTSAIGTDTIDSGTLSIYTSSEGTGFGAFTIQHRIVTTTPASNTAIANSDYGNTGTTAQATDKVIDGTAQYTVWTLNATGLSNVSKTGITKFGIKAVNDADNSPPTWSSTASCGLNVQTADTTDVTSDPKLIIIHSATASVNANFLAFM